MSLKAGELEDIVSVTLQHYEERAADFWRGTREHDVSQNVAALLPNEAEAPRFSVAPVR